ncbi:exopolyphosphatase [Bacillus gobiensis]|uniref:exopolyphosphatase n=1 Tax=Bacillus gobiensis TaxID=1441095 RepID=UPI003D1AE9EA
MMQKKYAIIDIGSNTMRLVIYLLDKSGRLKEIENAKAVARLRNYLSNDGFLTEEGIQKLISTLRSFQEVTRHHQLKEVKCVATATIRHAKNQQTILKRVQDETDFDMRILSEYEEAYFGYLAVVNSTPFTSGVTIDIGGGSTELTYFEDRKLVSYHSFPFGALSLKKQFVKAEKPTDIELKAISDFISDQFKSLEWVQDKRLPIIGIGGSARNMVQVHQEYTGYPVSGLHQYMMCSKDICEINDFLKPMTFSELQRVDGLSKDRADIILPAIEVFKCLLDTVNTDQFVLSRKGLRDGIFYEELKKENGTSLFPNVIEKSFSQLATDYEININNAWKMIDLSMLLARLLHDAGLTRIDEQDTSLLKRGAYVYNLGSYIDSETSSQHTFYLLANRTIDGLLHKERILLALLASFKNKSEFKRNADPFQQWFSKSELAKYRLLGAILKFAHSLNATKRNIVKKIELKENEGELNFFVTCNQDWTLEQYQAEKQKKHLEKQLKKSINVFFTEE